MIAPPGPDAGKDRLPDPPPLKVAGRHQLVRVHRGDELGVIAVPVEDLHRTGPQLALADGKRLGCHERPASIFRASGSIARRVNLMVTLAKQK